VPVGYASLGHPVVHGPGSALTRSTSSGTCRGSSSSSGLVWTVVAAGTTIALSQRRYLQLTTVGATMLVMRAALV
jgi:hypothetical protein